MTALRMLTAAVMLFLLEPSCAQLDGASQEHTPTDTWVQVGDDIDGLNPYDEFGGAPGAIAMSKDGNVLVVGAPGNEIFFGHVRIFEMRHGVWEQRGSAIGGEKRGDRSERTVAISANGNIVAIGANEKVSLLKAKLGHVRVYKWHSKSGTWKQLGEDIDGEGRNDYMSGPGRAIAMSADGHTMAIGAFHNDNEAGRDAGHVRVYDFNKQQGWVQRGSDINGEQGGDGFGCAVAMSEDGNTFAAGAMFNDAKELDSKSGHVRVFDWRGGYWTQRGGDIDGESKDYSGSAVAMSSSGNSIAVGSPGYIYYRYRSSSNSLPSRVRVYDWDKSLDWVQRGLVLSGEDVGDGFGTTLDMSADGNSLAVGAHLHVGAYPNDSPWQGHQGHVRCFDWDSNSWVQRGSAIEGENRFDRSGTSVSMDASGHLVASSAPYSADAGYRAGHVRVFRWQTQTECRPTNSGTWTVLTCINRCDTNKIVNKGLCDWRCETKCTEYCKCNSQCSALKSQDNTPKWSREACINKCSNKNGCRKNCDTRCSGGCDCNN